MPNGIYHDAGTAWIRMRGSRKHGYVEQKLLCQRETILSQDLGHWDRYKRWYVLIYGDERGQKKLR